MNRLDHLLTIAAEECAEIAQRISKAQRFGLGEIQPGQALDNAERIRLEFVDLKATLIMVEEEASLLIGELTRTEPQEIAAKRNKVEAFLELSAKEGRLDQ